MARPPSGPGIAKVRTLVVSRRSLELVAVREGWWSSLFEHADVVSEGAVQADPSGPVYYGSTSLRCALSVEDGFDDHATCAPLPQWLLANPHARLRLLRLAHREAASRAAAALDVLQAEMRVRLLTDDGRPVLAIDLDVSAPLVTAVAAGD